MYNKVLNQVNTYYNNNRDIIFFLFFFMFYLILCILFFGFNNSYIRYLGFVFHADHGRVFHDIATTDGFVWSTVSHPFFALISQSFISLLKFIFHSTRFSIIIFIALSVTSSIFLLKKCIEKITGNINSALIISLIYGFSFSTVVFGSMPETYIVSSMTNLFCIYYIACLIKSDVKTLTTKNIFILVCLGLLNFGILYSNLVLDIFYFIFLFINIYSKDIKNTIITVLKVIIIFAVLGIFLTLFQKLIFPKHDLFFWHVALPCEQYFDFNFDLKKLLWVIKCNYLNCFYGFNLYTACKNGINGIFLAYQHVGLFKLFPALLFYGIIVFNFIKNYKNFSDNNNSKFVYFFILILVYNLFSNIIFSVKECFLFGQTTLIFIMLLCGVALGSAKDNFSKWICYFLILVELIQNTRVFKNIIYPHISALNTQNSFSFSFPIIYSLITFSVFAGLIFLFKKLVNKDILNASLENKFFIALLLLLGYMVLYILFNAMFMGYEEYNIAIIS